MNETGIYIKFYLEKKKMHVTSQYYSATIRMLNKIV